MSIDTRDCLQLFACYLMGFIQTCLAILFLAVGCSGLVIGVLVIFDAHPAFIKSKISLGFSSGLGVILSSILPLSIGCVLFVSFYDDCFPTSDGRENHSSIEPTTDEMEMLSSQKVNTYLNISRQFLDFISVKL